jgi:hypothetical protein
MMFRNAFLPQSGSLRVELGWVLLLKIVLLIGLWWLIFRWMDRPTHAPDIARHFDLPALSSSQPVH